MTLFLSSTDADFEQKFKTFLAVKRENDPDVNAVVAEIVADVRKKGDEALCAYTQKFDRVNLTPATMRVSQSEIDEPSPHATRTFWTRFMWQRSA